MSDFERNINHIIFRYFELQNLAKLAKYSFDEFEQKVLDSRDSDYDDRDGKHEKLKPPIRLFEEDDIPFLVDFHGILHDNIHDKKLNSLTVEFVSLMFDWHLPKARIIPGKGKGVNIGLVREALDSYSKWDRKLEYISNEGYIDLINVTNGNEAFWPSLNYFEKNSLREVNRQKRIEKEHEQLTVALQTQSIELSEAKKIINARERKIEELQQNIESLDVDIDHSKEKMTVNKYNSIVKQLQDNLELYTNDNKKISSKLEMLEAKYSELLNSRNTLIGKYGSKSKELKKVLIEKETYKIERKEALTLFISKLSEFVLSDDLNNITLKELQEEAKLKEQIEEHKTRYLALKKDLSDIKNINENLSKTLNKKETELNEWLKNYRVLYAENKEIKTRLKTNNNIPEWNKISLIANAVLGFLLFATWSFCCS